MRSCVQILAVAASAMLAAGVRAQGPVVNTKYGPVQGTTNGDVDVWHSIPFAAPPVGNLRFRPPAPPTPWTEVKDVSGLPNICPQLKIEGGLLFGNEDCLYLHVYRPQLDQPEPLPVLFWNFGGGWELGDGYEFGWYDGTNLARNNKVIVVTPNYRVGPLGFLALDELRNQDGTTGNAGLLDQRFAMQWVQDNIAAFGGDPTRVAIFGESAGGFSVCWHLATPGSKGLFSAAIMESGSCDSPQFFRRMDDAVSFSELYSLAVGCNATGQARVNCMQSIPTSQVLVSILDWFNPNWPFVNLTVPEPGKPLEALDPSANRAQQLLQTVASRLPANAPAEYVAAMASMVAGSFFPAVAPVMPWGAAIDNSVGGLSDTPLMMMKKGIVNKVPTIMGSNSDEASLFVPALPIVVPGASFPPNDAAINGTITHLLDMFNASFVSKTILPMVLNEYPSASFKDDTTRLVALFTHYFFNCPARRAVQTLSQAGVPVYLYYFDYKMDFIEYDLLGDYHTAELSFVWDNAWPPILHTFSETDSAFAKILGQYWSNMAWNGSPNDATVPLEWPAYNSTTSMNMNLAMPVALQTDLLEGECNFWDTVQTMLLQHPN